MRPGSESSKMQRVLGFCRDRPVACILGVIVSLLCAAAVVPATAAIGERGDYGWHVYTNDEGTQVDVPGAMFHEAGASTKGTGERFRSTDGKAQLSIYVLRNDDAHTPASYLRKHMTD